MPKQTSATTARDALRIDSFPRNAENQSGLRFSSLHAKKQIGKVRVLGDLIPAMLRRTAHIDRVSNAVPLCNISIVSPYQLAIYAYLAIARVRSFCTH